MDRKLSFCSRKYDLSQFSVSLHERHFIGDHIEFSWSNLKTLPINDFDVASSVAARCIEGCQLGVILWLYLLHNQQVARNCCLSGIVMADFARHLGLPFNEQVCYFGAGFLHDIGHLDTKDGELERYFFEPSQPGVCNKGHAQIGETLIRKFGLFRGDCRVSEVARWHHERIDGLGFPDGLLGNEIPAHVRVSRVCIDYSLIFLRNQASENITSVNSRALALMEMSRDSGVYDAEVFGHFCKYVMSCRVG